MQRGTIVGPYRIESRVGSGAMGEVYAAIALEGAGPVAPGTRIALKVVRAELLKTRGFFQRFLREAEIGQAVRHPNVVRTLECDSVLLGERRVDYLAMEFVEGRTLRAVLEHMGRVPEDLCRHLGREIARGLSAIHAAGVVHRDLKPENVIVTADHTVKVMDLGVARVVDEAGRLSSTGSFVGCLHYAAPEQLEKASEDLDGRADLHALGIVLYELATGAHPFPGAAVPVIVQHVLNTTPRPLREVAPEISEFFEAVVAKLLIKDREQRFASGDELADVLEWGEGSPWWGNQTPVPVSVRESTASRSLEDALAELSQSGESTREIDLGTREVAIQLRAGQRVGSLVVEHELGRGGYGAVFLARDTVIDRPVALKVLLPHGREVTDRDREAFLAEARVVAGIPNPHIVTLYSVHPSEDGGWRIEMEYLDGGSLQDVINTSGTVPASQALPIARGVLDGLRAAHERGVLHRDIKPANVLLGRDGQVKLADFGLAKVLGERAPDGPGAAAVVGTPWYMAPELFTGGGASVQGDLWAVGAVIHEMVTGAPPFPNGSMAELIRSVRTDPPPALGDDVPPFLARVVQRCLAKRPEDRPRSASELITELDLLAGRSTIAAPAARGTGRLFGRADEMRRVTDVLRTVSTGRSAVLAIHGEAGIGKSALVEEASLASGPFGFRWMVVRASPGGLVHPLLAAVRDTVEATSGPGGFEAWLDAGDLRDAAPIARRLLASGAGLEVASRVQVIWALERLLRRFAGADPLCLVVEDLHVATEDATSLLRDLASRLADTRFLLIDSRRPPGPDVARIGRPDSISIAERIELGALDPEAVLRLLEDRADGLSVAADAAERIARRSGGNPLIAIELFRHLRDTGALAAGDDEWTATDEWDEAALPLGLRDVYARRLADLDGDERELLETAAVDGVGFAGAALSAVLEVPKLSVLRRLQRLARRGGYLRASGDGFEFEHALLREILYDETAPELRVALHEAFARQLETRTASDADVDPERIGTHWERAGDRQRAVPFLVEAAADAAGRHERYRALELVGRTGVLSGDPDLDLFARHGTAIHLLAMLHRDMGLHEDALRLYEALAEAATRSGNDEMLATARVQIALTHHHQGSVTEEDRGVLKTAAAQLPVCATLGMTHNALGLLAQREGRLDAAADAFRRADAVFQELGLEHLHAWSLSQLAGVANRRGRAREAADLWEEAAAISERIGKRDNAAVDRVNAVSARMSLGLLEGSRELLETAVRTFELSGSRAQVAKGRSFLAELSYALGDLPTARRAADRAIDAAREIHSDQTLAHALLVSARLELTAGRADCAADRMGEASTLVERLGEVLLRPHVHSLRALLRACLGDPEGAEQASGAALAACEESGDTPETLVAELLLLSVFRCGGGFWERAEALTLAAEELPEDVRATALVSLRGAMAAEGDEAAAEAAARSADELRSDRIGDLRAELRVVAAWHGAVAEQRRGGDGAAAAGEAAAGTAARLGHVFLEAAMLRQLEEWSPSAVRRRRLEMLVRRTTTEIADPSIRAAVEAAWQVSR